jgi:hypothetical protein
MNARISVLLARQAPVGVIFRRGPSKRVLMIRWDLERDTFEAGQWLKGRVYADQCDLSPRGEFLIYCAANHKGEDFGTWTAISRPPYFTALALWPLDGTWQGGGGIFLSGTQVVLSHIEPEPELAAGFSLPSWLMVSPEMTLNIAPTASIFTDHRRYWDGWHLVGKTMDLESGTVDLKDLWLKRWPRYSPNVLLRVRNQINSSGPHPRTYELAGDSRVIPLGAADWADWCPSGDLLLAREGRIYRIGNHRYPESDGFVRELIDLSPLQFEAREAPPEARQWEGPPPAGSPLPPSSRPADVPDLQTEALRSMLARL